MWQLFFKTMACPQPGGLVCDPTFCQAHTLLYLAYQLGILPDSAQTFQILPQGPEQMTHIWACVTILLPSLLLKAEPHSGFSTELPGSVMPTRAQAHAV